MRKLSVSEVADWRDMVFRLAKYWPIAYEGRDIERIDPNCEDCMSGPKDTAGIPMLSCMKHARRCDSQK